MIVFWATSGILLEYQRRGRMTSTDLRQRAYEDIQGRILAGKLSPGAQVSELSLAKEIGMSRTPVREAIRRLVHEGLLAQVPRLGTMVCSVQRQDIVELYELREALESFAGRQAARRMTQEHLSLLERFCAEIADLAKQARAARATALDADGLQRFLSVDLAFHMVILRTAGNQRILKAVADSRVLTRIFGTPRQRHELAIVDKTYRYHSRIFRALRRANGDAAGQLIADHIRASKEEALEYYDRHCVTTTSPFPHGLPPDLQAELNRIEQSALGRPAGDRKVPRARA
jgi:DNA-binding GntR family transcriptional regulator